MLLEIRVNVGIFFQLASKLLAVVLMSVSSASCSLNSSVVFFFISCEAFCEVCS